MGSARATIAMGAAAATGAAVLLLGGIQGSAVTALALVLAARAAAAAAASAPVGVTRALGRQFATAPAWVAIVMVASMRAGSGGLDDVRGAHAVAGIALAHGAALAVIAAWFALGAGVVAVAAASGRDGALQGTLAPGDRLAVLDGAGAFLQVVLLVSLFAGPQVRTWTDAVPWLIGVAAVTAAALAVRVPARMDRADLGCQALAGVALVLMLAAPRL